MENRLSPKARAAYNVIDEKTRQAILKTNPFKRGRNRAIRDLKAKGLSAEILAELSGMNRGTIYKLAHPKDDIPEYLNEELEGLTGAFQSLLTILTRILGNTKGGE